MTLPLIPSATASGFPVSQGSGGGGLFYFYSAFWRVGLPPRSTEASPLLGRDAVNTAFFPFDGHSAVTFPLSLRALADSPLLATFEIDQTLPLTGDFPVTGCFLEPTPSLASRDPADSERDIFFHLRDQSFMCCICAWARFFFFPTTTVANFSQLKKDLFPLEGGAIGASSPPGPFWAAVRQIPSLFLLGYPPLNRR